MAVPEKPHRCPIVPRLHRILSLLYPQLLTCRTTPAGPDEESNPVDLGRSPNKSLRNPKDAHVHETGADPTAIRVGLLYDKLFVLHTDASAYGVGAILLQEGGLNPLKPSKPCLHPIAYYSATFTLTERNYDIYKQELLAVIKALPNWRPHLTWTPHPFTLITNHANLTFWKHPRKVNRRVARWFAELQDYDFEIKHAPGKTHTAADFLSRPFTNDRGEQDHEDVIVLPPRLFANSAIQVFDIDSIFGELDEAIVNTQDQDLPLMKAWQREHNATTISTLRPPYGEIPGWRKEGR